jgi:hypothetical protein
MQEQYVLINLNAMFFVNFHHYYMLCLCDHVSCNKKIINFKLLAVLLKIFYTRVGKICAHTFLIHVHSSSFITHSFLLTMNNCKHISFLLIFGDNGHNTPSHYAFWWTTAVYWLSLTSHGYAKFVGRSYTLAFVWVC